MADSNINKAVENLQQNGFRVRLFNQGEDALHAILQDIPEGVLIGFGGSWTVRQIGLYDSLREGNYTLCDQYKEGLSPEEGLEQRRKGLMADYYITGTNAITETGKLVNVDGMGNRVAGQIFGPRKVIIVASTNKIVKDIAGAEERIRRIAAPQNARRFGLDLPCVHGESCDTCPPDKTLCNVTSIIHRQRSGRISIYLIKQPLGY